MRERLARPVVWWLLAGIVAAIFLQWTQVRSLGGRWDALVYVGQEAPGRSYLLSLLPDLTLVPSVGHDGQTALIVATDPFMTDPAAAEALDSAGFRYRRILFPLLAGLGGLLSPTAAVGGMIVIAAVAYAVTLAAAAHLARGLRAHWAVVAVAVAPGLWLSIRLLTVDVVAMALLASALVALDGRRVRTAAALLALAALTKEVYIVAAVVAGVVAWRAGRSNDGRWLVGVPAGALAIWSLIVQLRVGEGFSPRGNLGAPFVGLVESVDHWIETGAGDLLLGTAVVASLVVGAWVAARSSWPHRHQLLPWLLIAVLMSDWVWVIPGNAARALLPVWVLAAVAVARQGVLLDA